MTATLPVRRPGARLAVGLAFLLAFLWQLLGAASNLLAWAGFAAVLHRQLSAFAWTVLLVGVAIPVVAYAAALVLGRRRTPGSLGLLLLVALCASEALSLSVLAFFQAAIGAR